MWQPLAQWGSWHLTMEGSEGPTRGEGWLPLTSGWEGVCKLAKPVCVLAAASLLNAAPGSGAADAQAGRIGGGVSLCSQHDAGPGKMTVFTVIPSSSTNLHFFKDHVGKMLGCKGQKPISSERRKRGYIGSWTTWLNSWAAGKVGMQLGFVSRCTRNSNMTQTPLLSLHAALCMPAWRSLPVESQEISLREEI